LVRLGEQHVAQDLSGHHDHVGVAVHRGIPRQQSHALVAVEFTQLFVFLVRQGLEGRRVESSLASFENSTDGVIRDERLTRTRRCTDEDIDVLLNGVNGLKLERVQTKTKCVDESVAVVGRDHFFSNLPTPMAMK